MRIAISFFICVALGACGHHETDDGRSESQRKTAAKTDEAAKKGALEQKEDPVADLKKQKQNLVRLEANRAASREAGNTIGSWAAQWDAHTVRKLIAKDEAKIAGAR